jgi:Flp pilus assembly protein TadG
MLRVLTRYLERGGKILARFRAAQNGATAVEFALIAPAFFATLIAVIETTLFLFAQQNLQTAAVQAGRLFMTGNAQNSGTTQAQFQAAICPSLQALFNCNNVMVNVQAYSSFSDATTAAPTLTYNSNGTVSNTWSYTAGTPGQVMVVQLIYQWPVIGGPLGFTLSNLANGTAEIMGVSAFRVEPY